MYVHSDADLNMAIDIIINAKTSRISVCNALDKVLINSKISSVDGFVKKLIQKLLDHQVEIIVDSSGMKNF